MAYFNLIVLLDKDAADLQKQIGADEDMEDNVQTPIAETLYGIDMEPKRKSAKKGTKVSKLFLG